jgi:hypothetical protein
LQAKGDRPSPSRPGAYYGSGYHAVATETGSYIQVADATAGPYHAPPCNPTWWAICIPGRAAQTRDQWLNDVSRQYIRGVARFIVDKQREDGMSWPLQFCAAPDLVKTSANLTGHPTGYTSHSQVSQAWHQTDHTDPGVGFPWDVLATDIAALITAPIPVPTQASIEENIMYRSNAAPMVVDGQTYAPGRVWFELLPGGKGRHVTSMNEVVAALGGTEADCVNNVSVRRPNAVLEALGAV